VVEVAAAVENDGLDVGLLRRLGEQLAHLGRLLGLVALERLPELKPARGGERLPVEVVDELRRNPAVRAEDDEARALGCAGDLLPDALVAPPAELVLDERRGHQARLPTFLRTYSPS
jgi:hypothetical protein